MIGYGSGNAYVMFTTKETILILIRHQFLNDVDLFFARDNFQKFLIKQLEAIKFASDWHQRSTKPGIRRFKKEFVQRSFDADPAHRLLRLNGTSEQQNVYKKAISAFKVRHGKLITARNYLLQLYQRVCATAVYVIF